MLEKRLMNFKKDIEDPRHDTKVHSAFTQNNVTPANGLSNESLNHNFEDESKFQNIVPRIEMATLSERSNKSNFCTKHCLCIALVENRELCMDLSLRQFLHDDFLTTAPVVPGNEDILFSQSEIKSDMAKNDNYHNSYTNKESRRTKYSEYFQSVLASNPGLELVHNEEFKKNQLHFLYVYQQALALHEPKRDLAPNAPLPDSYENGTFSITHNLLNQVLTPMIDKNIGLGKNEPFIAMKNKIYTENKYRTGSRIPDQSNHEVGELNKLSVSPIENDKKISNIPINLLQNHQNEQNLVKIPSIKRPLPEMEDKAKNRLRMKISHKSRKLRELLVKKQDEI